MKIRFCHLSGLSLLSIFLLSGVFSILANDPPSSRARVVHAIDSQAVRLLTPDPNRVRKLFNAALLQFTNCQDTGAAWKKIISPTNHIGIKINTLPGPIMSSRLSLVETIIDGLESAGVARKHIIIFDRYALHMETAGYPIGQRPDGVTITATVPHVGYDPTIPLDFPIPGKLVWGDLEFKRKGQQEPLDHETSPNDNDQLSAKSYLSKILTQQVDKVINIGIPTTDHRLGIYGCELNITLALIDNFRRLQQPSFAREDSITTILSNPIIQKKCVLHILDALIAQYAGGPRFDPNYCWSPKSIYISRDAVALDAIALQLINKQRPSAELAPIQDQAAYIQTAASNGLGVADLSHIDIEDVPFNQ